MKRKNGENDSSRLNAPKSRKKDDDWDVMPGAILRVRLKNFMCHQEFEYVPNTRLNFLCGANGSGKSAVLTAIVYALGGTARMSNRGQSNKGLIRTGQSSATVEITLCNVGENCFKHEVYGDSITVVRVSNASGGGHYKFKDHEGRIVDVKRAKEELSRMLGVFYIQIDNPVAILNQDSAKMFLHTCDRSKLYDFFMRATQLNDCKINYEKAAEEKLITDDMMIDKEAHLESLKTENNKWKKKFELFQDLEERKAEIKELKGELAWSLVIGIEGELKKEEDKLSKTKDKLKACEEKIAEKNRALKTGKERKNQAEDDIQKLVDERKAVEAELDAIKDRVRRAKNDEKTFKRSADEARKKLSDQTATTAALRSSVEKLENEDKEANEEQNRARAEEIEEITQRWETFKAKRSTARTHITNLEASIKVCDDELNKARTDVFQAKNAANKTEAEIKRIRAEKDNKYAMFGQNIGRLVEAVKRSTKFQKKPVGPIGSYLSFKEGVREWEKCLAENEIFSSYRNFVVDNFRDQRELMRLTSSMGVNVGVVMCKFRDAMYDVARGKVQCREGRTVFDVLNFDDVNVANCLIDTKKIESVLLLPTEDIAQKMMMEPRNVPRNCDHAVVYADDPGRVFNYVAKPTYKSYCTDFKQHQRKLGASLQDHLRYFETELAAQMTEWEDKKKAYSALENGDIIMHLAQKDDHVKKLRLLDKDITKTESKLQALETMQNASSQVDVEALRDDLERELEKEEGLRSELEEAEEKVQRAEEKYRIVKDEYDSRENESDDRAVDALRRELTDAEDEITRIVNERTHLSKKKDEYTAAIPGVEVAMGKIRTERDKKIEKAVKWSEERVETKSDREAIHKKICAMENNIRQQIEVNEPYEIVQREHNRLSKLCHQVSKQVSSLRKAIRRLESTMEIRRKGLVRIRGSVSRRVKMNFYLRLSARNYAGELKFDHKNGFLDISVNPEGGHSGTMRDLKTLSGGEKSYSTISLVLALWDSMSPPFRILDEFDVFMDMMNRRVALDLITSYAKDARKYQYIFLTPLNTDNVEVDDDLSILKLAKNQG